LISNRTGLIKQILSLSGSSNGRNIKIAATATAGTLIHTASASDLDEIWIYATNSSTSNVKLTIEFGGVTDADDLIEKTIPAEDGFKLIIPGLLLTNSLVVRAFAATTNVININGFVNRIAS
jgi:hypothetical protein